MDVTETLVWQFAGDTSHGIQRFIRTSAGYDQKPDTYRRYELGDVTASSPSGAPADVAVTETGAETRIRIGSPDETVQGRQTYVLHYHLAHVVNGFADHSELYWNVTGQRVDIPTDAVRVTVRGPAAVTRAACFYGAQGSTDTCPATAGRPGDVRRPRPRPGRAGQHRRVVPARCGHRRDPRPAPGRDRLLRRVRAASRRWPPAPPAR